MRPFFLFVAAAGLLLGSTVPARAQAGGEATTHGVIKWGGYAQVPTTGARKQRVPTASEAQLTLDDQVGWFSLRLDGSVGQGQLLNLVYEPFAAADAKLFDLSKLPAGPEPRLASGTEMKRPVTHLSLRPVRRNAQTGQPERLLSFDYSYAADAGPAAARSTTTTRPHALNSVLRSGDWFKMGVAESGIYKLDKAALGSLGLNTGSVDPRNIHIYGNAMGLLPQPNAAPRPDDLAENNVLFVGNTDNIFNDGEYFLFYSPGAHTWEANAGVFRHRNNIFTDTTFYFVTANATPGLRVPVAAALAPTASTPTISTFTYRDFHERDLANLLHSGRYWVGEGFANGGQKDFAFSNIPDLVPNTQVRVVASLVANSATASSFQLTLNGLPLASPALTARPNYDFGAIATVSITTNQAQVANPGTEFKVGLTYNSSDPSASGYLDYLEINAQRQLRLSGAQLEFRSLANILPGARNRYEVANAAGATVWDVTNPRRPEARPLSGGSFVAPADTLREYVAFQPGGAFATPRFFGRVANQNLHALNAGPGALLDLVIVTHPTFKAQALRLASHRATHDNLRTAVVTTTEVYNEFGSGGQDVTAIRDFMKQLYDRDSRGNASKLALLLFGDASFDYKSDPYNSTNPQHRPAWWKDRVPFKNDPDFDAFNQNYVPTYQSRESLAPFFADGEFGQGSYSSDDYYGLLDDDEGEWIERGPSNELLDIAIGRLPVRLPKGQLNNTTQARQVVDKIIGYDSPAAYGKWRNRITLVSDDGDNDLFVGGGSETIAPLVLANAPAYNVHKVYLDLYPQLAVAAGQRSPETNRAIDQSVEQGSLMVNYLGHGGPKGWTNEQILTNASVLALRNPDNLTFFITGTCDFSTFDNPDFTSAGEQVLTDNPTGGAVGLFTTTRVVDANPNAVLNQFFFKRVLSPVNGQMPSIGTAVRLGKNDYPGVVNNRNYTLLADPSMTLAYPRQTVVLDSINRRTRTGTWVPADTLQALARIRLRGRLMNGASPNTAFTGRAQVTIYDKPTTVMTLGDELANSAGDFPRPVEVQENVIYGGQANVVNGQFSLSFVVPRDINYSHGLGKISLYAFDGTNRVDANGYQLKLIGGAARGMPNDTIPPRIRLFMDNESFAFGGLTAQNATLLARLEDESGINTTGAGIGHDITAILDNDQSKLLVLNDSYVANVGDFTSGRVNNLFKDLPTGPHSLRLKAWDTYNNSAERDLEFMVARDEKLALDHVLNYPNPFAGSTTFFFDHNQAGNVPGTLDVQVQIFTVAGRLVRTLTAAVPSTESHQKSITWNGRDEYDDQLARGVYVYRVSVRSQANNTIASKFEKLVILN